MRSSINTFTQYFGAATGVLGSLLIALNIGAPIVLAGFISFLISNVALAIWGFRTKSYGILWMNFVFIFIDSFGVYRWFGDI